MCSFPGRCPHAKFQGISTKASMYTSQLLLVYIKYPWVLYLETGISGAIIIIEVQTLTSQRCVFSASTSMNSNKCIVWAVHQTLFSSSAVQVDDVHWQAALSVAIFCSNCTCMQQYSMIIGVLIDDVFGQGTVLVGQARPFTRGMVWCQVYISSYTAAARSAARSAPCIHQGSLVSQMHGPTNHMPDLLACPYHSL